MQQQPNEKKFDFATIAVIIVSIGLILGGFYLLNQSFTGKQKPSQTTPSTSKSTESINSSKSSSSSVASSSLVLSSASIVSSSVISSSAISSSSQSSSSSSSSSSTSTTSSVTLNTSSTNLTSEQALIKVISIEGSQYQIETVETGYKDGRLWKVGKQLKITSTKPLSADRQYLVSDISEGANSVQFGSIVEK
jgi:cytoskeletal protein RodZ